VIALLPYCLIENPNTTLDVFYILTFFDGESQSENIKQACYFGSFALR